VAAFRAERQQRNAARVNPQSRAKPSEQAGYSFQRCAVSAKWACPFLVMSENRRKIAAKSPEILKTSVLKSETENTPYTLLVFLSQELKNCHLWQYNHI
jgi:hypothetical protein